MTNKALRAPQLRPFRLTPLIESVESRLMFATFVVTNVSDSGLGSLREAITNANANLGSDQITFNIPGTGLQTITPLTALPPITEAVSLDGTTQPGFFIDQIPVVQLNGANAGAGADGVVVNSDNVFVQGLTINRFSGNGITVRGNNAFIALNNLGTSPTATDPTVFNRPGLVGLGNGANGISISGNNCLVVNCIIAFNAENGVSVLSGVRNDIGLNSYFSNGRLGIDLGGDGPTPNDDGDIDSGANDLFNTPIINVIETEGDSAFIFGAMRTVPNRTVTLTFYSSPNNDGQGRTLLTPSNVEVMTDETGNASFNTSFPVSKARGYITVVATSSASEQDEFPNVSEFSAAKAVPGTVPPRITGAFFNGRSWSEPFRAALVSLSGGDATLGYRLPAIDSPSVEVPWTGLDQVSLQFDRDVRFETSTFRVAGVQIPIYGISGISYNRANFAITFTLTSPINLADRLTIISTGVVSASDGTIFDGDNDGFSGGAYRKPLVVLPGDQDLSRDTVDAGDLVRTRNRIGRTITSPGSGSSAYSVFGDIDGSGAIDATDLVLVRNRTGSKIPAAPASIFSTSRIAPLRRAADIFAAGDEPLI